MPVKKYTWYKVANHIGEIDFAENDIAVAEIGNKKICLALIHDNMYAFAYRCPHAGGILANGYIDALGNIVCPLHHYKYNPQNGGNVSGEGYYLTHWPVEVRKDGVYVAQDESENIFG